MNKEKIILGFTLKLFIISNATMCFTESSELIFCRDGSKWGLINTSGDQILDCTYDNMQKFENGLGQVKVGNTWVYVDSNGTVYYD